MVLLCLVGLAFKNKARKSAPHMDGLRVTGLLVSIGSENVDLKSKTCPAGGCALRWRSVGRTVHSVPEIHCTLAQWELSSLWLTWLGVFCLAAFIKSKPNFVEVKMGGRSGEGVIILQPSADFPIKYLIQRLQFLDFLIAPYELPKKRFSFLFLTPIWSKRKELYLKMGSRNILSSFPLLIKKLQTTHSLSFLHF